MVLRKMNPNTSQVDVPKKNLRCAAEISQLGLVYIYILCTVTTRTMIIQTYTAFSDSNLTNVYRQFNSSPYLHHQCVWYIGLKVERTHNNHTMWGNGWNVTISIIEPKTKGFLYNLYTVVTMTFLSLICFK